MRPPAHTMALNLLGSTPTIDETKTLCPAWRTHTPRPTTRDATIVLHNMLTPHFTLTPCQGCHQPLVFTPIPGATLPILALTLNQDADNAPVHRFLTSPDKVRARIATINRTRTAAGKEPTVQPDPLTTITTRPNRVPVLAPDLPRPSAAEDRTLSTPGRKDHTPDLTGYIQPPVDQDRLLTPGEVAKMYRVDPKTVTRWAQAGRLPSLRTLGGHRRFRESVILFLLAQDDMLPTDDQEQTA